MTDTSDSPTRRRGYRPPAAGPRIILDPNRFYAALVQAMESRGMVHQHDSPNGLKYSAGEPNVRALSDFTGVDRNTLSRFFARARRGEFPRTQRGGLNVNAYLTLVGFINGTAHTADGRLVPPDFARHVDQEN